MPFPVAKAFLCLGRKYEIEHLREQAIERLAIDFPATWQDFELYFKLKPKAIELMSRPGDMFKMVTILREHNLLLFLPWLLYRCFHMDHSGHTSLFLKSPDTLQPILCLDDIQVCSQALGKLCRLQASETFAWLDPSLTCADKQCDAMRRSIMQAAYYPVTTCAPFSPWDVGLEAGLCAECAPKSRDSHNAGRQRVWEQLPSVFGLPDWEELRESSMVCPA